jgi:hypothetical protein
MFCSSLKGTDMAVGNSRAGPGDDSQDVVLGLTPPCTGSGLLEAFGLGLAELGCWGDTFAGTYGYPFFDEANAFAHDWLNLSGDFEAAICKGGPAARKDRARATGATDNGKNSRDGASAQASSRK